MMSWSSESEWFSTSAVANDRVSDVRSARTRLTRNAELGLDAWLVVVGAHVLFDFQLHAVPARLQVGPIERAFDSERSTRQIRQPVAIDVHVAREEGALVTPNRHHKDRLHQVV